MPVSECTRYQSYLLRLWRDHPRSPWRASLQSTATGEQHHFADLADLLAFLHAQIKHTPPDDHLPDPPPGAAMPSLPADWTRSGGVAGEDCRVPGG
ncbi:MAG: hypothetical protein ACRDI2_26140 [Chloroflexota bacterium]